MAFIDSLRGSFPRLDAQLGKISDFHSRKLWHQLCLELEDIVKTPEFQNEGVAQELYTQFIADFELKLNALKLAKIINVLGDTFKDPAAAVAFLNMVAAKIEAEKEAWAFLKSNVVRHMLRSGDVKGAQSLADEVKTTIEAAGTVDNSVNSAFYKAYSLVLKELDKPNEFYRTALLYLAYTPAEEMSVLEQQAVAFDMGIAALIADNVYNFGELLAHPAVETLAGSDAEWLLHLLRCFNRGNIPEFHTLVQTYQKVLASQDALNNRSAFLEEKIRLMSIMELVFSRGAGQRLLSFEEVAQHTGVDVDAVEVVLLKALALGLIRGKIDQVDQTVEVTWVQPRVLDLSQIASVNENIGKWIEKVQSTLVFIESETPELFA